MCHEMERDIQKTHGLMKPSLFDLTTGEYMGLAPVLKPPERVLLFREMCASLPSIRNWMRTGTLEWQGDGDVTTLRYDALEHLFMHWPRILTMYERAGLLHLAPAWFINERQAEADEAQVPLTYPVLQRYYLQVNGSTSQSAAAGKVPESLSTATSSSTVVEENWVAEYEAQLAGQGASAEKTQEAPLQGISVERFADSESADELAQDLADEFANELVVESIGISSTMSANVDQVSMRDVGSIASSAAAHGATLARVSRFCEAMAIGKALCNTR
jgi:hypothetical protein